MRILFLCLVAAGLFAGAVHAQSFDNPFKHAALTGESFPENASLPQKMEVFEADFAVLDQMLRQAPAESAPHQFSIALPVPGGQTVPFAVWQIDIMHPELGARYPEIRTYAGAALDGSGRRIRITTSPYWGFHGMLVNADRSVALLEPVSSKTIRHYALYEGRDLPTPDAYKAVQCGVEDEPLLQLDDVFKNNPATHARGAADPVPLHIYRFACATTGGYSQDNGGTVPAVLASVVQKVNAINEPIEQDISLRLQLIPQNDQIIYLDANTDPYTGTDLANWINENVLALGNTIGNASFDLGHVIGRGTGSGVIGLASLNSACTIIKASGASSGQNPYGLFFLGTFAHEVGHQLSATHTYNYCPPNDPTSSTAFEPASGSTIMSYGGVCGGNNVVSLTDLYYHNISIQQARNYTINGTGSSCGTFQNTGNLSPEAIVVTPDSLYLPISTPFVLKGDGLDENALDTLTFCWEQYDLGESVSLGDEGVGSPLFRSFPPTTSRERTIPRLNDLVNNISSPDEILPTMTRQLNFRLTVRDNNAESGGVDWERLRLLVTDQAGPFVVQNPNTNILWAQGSYQLVEWDVANTDASPVNCQTVNIRLSTDGGFTYPVELAAGLPNNGIAYVQVPSNITSNSARIRVEAADNTFFDISNANFRIAPATTPALSLGTSIVRSKVCFPDQLQITVYTSGLAGFADPVTLSVASGLPPGAQASFNPATVTPGQTAVLTLDVPNSAIEADYLFVVRGTSTLGTTDLPIELSLISSDYSALAQVSPGNGAGGVVQNPVLQWNSVPDADAYEVEVATNPAFDAAQIISRQTGIQANSVQVNVILEKGKVYYWRLRPVNNCGFGDWVGPSVFVTGVDQCVTYVANDLPKNISAGSTATVTSEVFVSAGTVSDVNVKKIGGSHENFQHLDLRLKNPAGTSVQLFNFSCSGSVTYDFGFDDASPTPLGCPPSKTGTLYKPKVALSAFNNTDGGGLWVLEMRDVIAGAGGTFSAFELEVCSAGSLNGPSIVVNTPLTLPSGNNSAIGSDLLRAEDSNNGPDQLVFTLMSKPIYGRLELYGAELQPGAQFTQVDINNGALRYFDYGISPTDNFLFSVTDNEGGLAAGTYNITPIVSVDETRSPVTAFGLQPNPSSGNVLVTFPTLLRADAQVSVVAVNGQVVWTQSAARGAAHAQLLLSQLPGGMYIVRVQDAGGVGTQRLILQR